jgi:hypothetical protein
MQQHQIDSEADQNEAATTDAIATCGGDARATVKSLLILTDFLERELALAKMAVSYGYSKGWHSKSREPDVQSLQLHKQPKGNS